MGIQNIEINGDEVGVPVADMPPSAPTVKVCDAIMGSGKTEAAISYMNANPDKKFVYVTPYLDEAARIKSGCPKLNFAEPQNNTYSSGFSKVTHTAKLLSKGRNIATTHSAFRMYTKEMIDNIRDYGYTLIIDEALDVFIEQRISSCDIELLTLGGYITKDRDAYTRTDKAYRGKLSSIVELIDKGSLYYCSECEDGGEKDTYYYWAIPHNVLCSFSDVILLTYMFSSSDFRYFLDMFSVPYKYIGVHYDGEHYTFADSPDYVPEHIKTIKDKIHIVNNERLNEVGRRKYSISKGWYNRDASNVKRIKDNIFNYYHNIHKCKSKDLLWTTYKAYSTAACPAGGKKGYTPFNLRGTNEYRDRTVLAFCVNLFASPTKKIFFHRNGIILDEDGAALSDMVQWVWRSAIRDGDEIWLYVPSYRMRTLFCNWLDSLAEGGECNVGTIEYEGADEDYEPEPTSDYDDYEFGDSLEEEFESVG